MVESEPKPYSISEEFRSTPPEQPERYVFPQKVTRANFASFLINDFRFSMGIPEIQEARNRWLEIHQGFDYRGTFNAFSETGGLFCLSKTERETIRKAYLGIRKHTSSGFTTYGILNSELCKQLKSTWREDSDFLFSEQLLRNMSERDLQNLLGKERAGRRLARKVNSPLG